MQFGISADAAKRVDDLLGRLDRLTAALEANTAAIDRANERSEYGPRK